MASKLSITFGVALTYALTAQLGFLMAMMPYWDASMVWPPSGIALAAVVRFGRNALAGIFLGALVTTFSALPNDFSPAWFGVVIAMTVSAGSTLAAVAAAAALQRIAPKGKPTVGAAQFLYGCMAIFAACSISALLGAGTLYFAGLVPRELLAIVISTWWLGDFCGVMIFGPVAWLVAYALIRSHKPSRRAPITTALLVNAGFVAIALLAFISLWNLDTRNISQYLQREANLAALSVTRLLQEAGRDVELIRALVYASISVTAEEFQRFTSIEFSDREQYFAQAVGWAPRVTDTQAWERMMQDELHSSVALYEVGSSGEKLPVGPREAYFPLQYIQPPEGNETAIGFDLASESSRRRALERARDTGLVSMVAPIALVQAKSAEPAILIGAPIYRPDTAIDTLSARRENLSGFASAVHSIRPLFASSLTENDTSINFHLFDLSQPGHELWYHSIASPSSAGEADAGNAPALENLTEGLHGEGTINFADHTWLVVATPGSGFVASQRTWTPWLTLILFLALGMISSSILLERIAVRARVAAERRKTMQALLEAQAANESKAFFMAAAGHDIKQPLIALGILTDTLLMTDPSAKSAPILAGLRRSITQMTEHFDALVDAGRFQDGDFELVLTRFRLSEIADLLDSEVSPLCAAKDLNWTIDVDDVEVLSDPQLLLRLLRNLLSNAVRYTTSGEVSCIAKARDDIVEFVISDTGRGIEPEHQKFVFSEFVSLEKNGARSPGAGLGLTIATKIDEALGLQLLMTSTPGEGTVFRFQVPLAPRD